VFLSRSAGGSTPYAFPNEVAGFSPPRL
jgi:hypothetical protein